MRPGSRHRGWARTAPNLAGPFFTLRTWAADQRSSAHSTMQRLSPCVRVGHSRGGHRQSADGRRGPARQDARPFVYLRWIFLPSHFGRLAETVFFGATIAGRTAARLADPGPNLIDSSVNGILVGFLRQEALRREFL